ncbi:MAG: biotin/lipoyl-binding protein [Oscillospiraceae bacterium]|nr:biotin/lipoyl-binding protein [Oscillospiraceae bacterium]
MKKFIIFLLCAAIISGGAYGGYRYYDKQRNAKKIVDVVPVSLMAQPADMFMYSGNDFEGNISAANAQRVYVDTAKLVQKVCVKKGQKVHKGDVILEYDMTVVELELKQKEAQVLMAEQDLKMAKKELAHLRTLRPSEEMPLPDEPYYPDEPDEPDYPDEPDIPEEPIATVTELGAAFTPLSGNGTPEDPFVIPCNLETVVHRPFMAAIASGNFTAQLPVYDEDSNFLYMWQITGGSISMAEADDWAVADGLIIDQENGTVSLQPNSGTLHGQLFFSLPRSLTESDPPEDFGDANDYMDDFFSGPDNYDDAATPDYGDNYMYSRKELERIIKEQEGTIKTMEIELKSAQLAYETAQKQKSEGKVTAEIDGVVKKIGKAADEAEEEQTEEEDPFAEPDPDENVFAIIEGEGGVEVTVQAPEMTLPQLQPGTKLNIMSYENGATCSAVVTSIDEEPKSYSSYNWGSNPQNSTYQLHATLKKPERFTIGSWVSVSIQESSDDEKKNSVFMPLHYVRRDGGDYYIMKADENDCLVKQYVSVGQILYGYYIEVTGGMSMSDRICFPYGNDVKEGIRTQDSSEVLYPS